MKEIKVAQQDWKDDWAPVIALVGTELDLEEGRPGVDRVEAGTIRRYVEPLELDCALHTDATAAQAHGYPDIIAPYTAISTFAMQPFWSAGRSNFTSAERNAQPAKSSVKPVFPPGTPPVTGYFATDMEVEYVRPVHLGERLTRRGNRLVECEPKETSVGRGAFIKTESRIEDEAGEVVARFYVGLYLYNPREKADR
ncbi:MAG: FAS1-like dehydratase domain-containing protein [Janthinobacterium lividum]